MIDEETKLRRDQTTKEIMSAMSCLFGQIKKGWTPQEAFQQVENAYGNYISDCVNYHLARIYSKKRKQGERKT